jgi:thiamine biosynthesis lipoprotein
MKYSLDCFGSKLYIDITSSSDLDSLIAESFSFIEDFETKYSRFISGNTLDTLNQTKTWILPPEIISLLELTKKVSSLTQGYFDITVLPILENNGYGIHKQKLPDTVGYKNIHIERNNIVLKNDIYIEFGSFGKWYIVDCLYNTLTKKSDNFIINFWWDIRVKWEHTILLEDPLDTKKHIWNISLNNSAIASSSWNKRKIWEWHHIVNPKNDSRSPKILAVYVTHKLWVFADIFSTALFVTPLDITKNILERVDGLEALIILENGKIFKTTGFHADILLS